MGQKASRTLAGRLEKGMQKYRNEMEKDIQSHIAEKQRRATPGGFTDPNAMEAGFTRGMSPPIRQDQEQEAFLQSQQHSQNQEMPEDLIQFLQDMGPVERKERTPRLRKHQLEERQFDEGRQKREMPIMEDVDKFTTTRTTNFSRRQEEKQDFSGLNGRELHRLLQDDKQEAAIQSIIEKSTAGEEEKKEYSKLLQNAIKYLQIPVIMKDTDATYVGIVPENVAYMKTMKLTVVPESEVRLVLSIEDPNEKEAVSSGSPSTSPSRTVL